MNDKLKQIQERLGQPFYPQAIDDVAYLLVNLKAERERSAKLFEALKNCLCRGKRGTPHFKNGKWTSLDVNCWRCEAIAKYQASRDDKVTP